MLKKVLNRSRQIYRQILEGAKPSEVHISDAIQAAEDFKGLKRHPGWKRLESWLERQKSGTHQYMESEVQMVSALSLVRLFNTFIKYIFMLAENRAYKKIQTYINVSIAKGDDYAKRRAKEELAGNK